VPSLSLSEPSCNISGVLVWDLEGGVFTSLLPAQCPWPAGRATSARHHQTILILGEIASLLANQGGEFQLHKGTQKGLGTNLGALLISLVRTWVQIQACFRRQKGSLINSQRHLSNPLLGVKPCLSGSESGTEVLCCVRVCEGASLRHSLVTK
jgi:hypothetical protein